MSTFSVIAILVLFNFPLVVMGVLASLKVRDLRTRRLFVGLAVGLIFWAVPLVLVRADFLSQEAVAFCSRLTFLGGVFAVFFLYFFCDGFGLGRGTKSRYVFALNALAVFSAVLGGFVESGVVPAMQGFAPVRGPLHKYYVVSMSLTVVAAFFRLAMIYRKNENSLLRFQIRSVAVYGFFGFLFPIVNNGVLPILIPEYAFPVFGVLGVLFFQFGIFRILVDGESLFIRTLFENIRSGAAWQIQENLVSLSRLTQLLDSILNDGVTSFRESYAFVNGSGEHIKFFAQSDRGEGNYGSMALFKEKVMPRWNEGLVDNLVRLEADNKRLALYLLRAESILREKWLSDAVGDMIALAQAPATIDTPLPVMLREIESHLTANTETFGAALCTFTPEMAKLMATAREIARTHECVLISGEVGSGRKTLASAIDFARTGRHALKSISCALTDINSLTRRIAELASGGDHSVLVADIDALPAEFLYILSPLIARTGPDFSLYLTVDSSFYGSLLDAPQLIFEKLNRIKLDVPPLRRRSADLVPLLALTVQELNLTMDREFTTITRDFISAAAAYHWPGNITELRHTVQRALLLSKEPLLNKLHLDNPLSLRRPEGPFSPLEAAERRVITEYLKKNNYNKNRTRLELDITVNTLNAKMEKYDIRIPDSD